MTKADLVKVQEQQRSGVQSNKANHDSQNLLEISKVELKDSSSHSMRVNELDKFAYRPDEKRMRGEQSSIEDPDAVRP